ITDAASKGGLSGARAALAGSTSASRNAEAQILAARAAEARARADAERLQADATRAESLLKVGGMTKVAVDNALSANIAAQASLAQAVANLSAAEEAKKTAESRIGEAAARVEQSAPVDAQTAVARAQADLAHARVKASEAALETATLQLSYATVRAPVDGVLSKLAVRAGQNVGVGQLVVNVVPTTTFVVANFKETQVGGIRAGAHVDVTIDSFAGEHLSGHVVSVSPATGARFSLVPPDNASGNFVKVVQRVPVRIEWDQPTTLPLVAGLSAEVTVDTVHN
ncbi:MAG TPA: HlyD family efflux transporter periplasmic adaptor subunit, partial [Myxococcota bacterium]